MKSSHPKSTISRPASGHILKMLLVKCDSMWLWYREPSIALPDASYQNQSSSQVVAGDLRISLGHAGTTEQQLEPVQCLMVFNLTSASWCSN